MQDETWVMTSQIAVSCVSITSMYSWAVAAMSAAACSHSNACLKFLRKVTLSEGAAFSVNAFGAI